MTHFYDPAQMTREDILPTYGIMDPARVDQDKDVRLRDMNRMAVTLHEYQKKGYSIVVTSRDMAEIAERIEWLEGRVRAQYESITRLRSQLPFEFEDEDEVGSDD